MQRLKQAHEARKDERFGEAAADFAHIAMRANEHGKHQMALHTAVLAARCLVRSGDRDAAVEQAIKAAGYAAPLKDGARTSKRFGKLVAKLREKGHTEDADAIEAAVKQALGVTKLQSPEKGEAPTVNRAMRRGLPKACGTCGAPVESGKVVFSEDGAADCRFCGTVLMA